MTLRQAATTHKRSIAAHRRALEGIKEALTGLERACDNAGISLIRNPDTEAKGGQSDDR